MAGIKGRKCPGSGPRPQLCPHGVVGKSKCRECKLNWERIWIEKGDNREKGRQATARWAEKNRAHNRAYARKRAGVPVHNGEAKNGPCPICKIESVLVPDHCHKTGTMRDWVCGPCNRALGFYERSKEEFERYLKRFDEKA